MPRKKSVTTASAEQIVQREGVVEPQGRLLLDQAPKSIEQRGDSASAILSPKLIQQFREQLSEAQRGAFDKLTDAGCDPARLADCVVNLRWAVEAFVEHQKDPKRMRWESLRSRTARMERAATDIDALYGSYFGRQVLERVLSRETGADRSAIKTEFYNIPQRLHSLAREARDVHRGTQSGKGKEYNDVLADLCVYVERAANEPRNLDVSILVDYAHGSQPNPYTENDLCVWKNKHEPELDRARLRLRP